MSDGAGSSRRQGCAFCHFLECGAVRSAIFSNFHAQCGAECEKRKIRKIAENFAKVRKMNKKFEKNAIFSEISKK